MNIGEYLIKAIMETGARHVFGIQGDYVLNFYSQLCASSLEVINTRDEQGAGFAADAYARLAGFGVVCVTYGVGGLNVVNSTAQAFAELSPVLVISGAPGMAERRNDPLLHHKVRSFETQLNVFREVTAAQALIDDPKTACAEINRVINAVKKAKRPGYIELPRDMVQEEIDIAQQQPAPESSETNRAAADEALEEVLSMLASAKNPMVVVGVEVHRFCLQSLVLELLERSHFAFVTGVLSKSVISEKHPQFIGVYAGAMSPDNVRRAVEKADCVIAIGPLLTDLSTGMFTHKIDSGTGIVISSDSVAVRHHAYTNINIKYFLESLIKAMPAPKNKSKREEERGVSPFAPEAGKKITVDRLFACLNDSLDDNTAVIAEPGDSLFGSLDMLVHEAAEFLSPAYYASLGFSVPASIGVQLAAPGRRPLVIVGDGAFQMTGMELSVSLRYKLNPVVVILNNGGYGTFRPMIDGPFNDIRPWRYADITGIIGGGDGYTVSTEEELLAALRASGESLALSIIDVRLEKYDCSKRLRELANRLKEKVKMSRA